jgi:hypothetical protein
VRLDEEIMLDNINANVTSITFRVRRPKCALKGYQSLLSHGDGALSAIQLPLLSKKLSLQFDTTTEEGDKILRQSASRSRRHDKEASPHKRRHRVKAHLADSDARLEEAPVPA